MNKDTRQDDVLVSVDGEFTGPIPGPYSMISMGAVAYSLSGEELSRFKVNIAELPGSSREPSTMAWWEMEPEAWQLATENPIDPVEAMEGFDEWLSSLRGQPKLMGWPLPVDFMFVYWYYVNFLGKRPPFGFDGVDIKSYAMGYLKIGALSDVSRSDIRAKLKIGGYGFLHDPVDDAEQQARIFFALRKL